MSNGWSIIISVTTATTRRAVPKAPGQDLASETWALRQRVAFSQRPRFMAIHRESDLVPPHWIALDALDEPKPMGELAKLLACDSSNITWITDRLAERGLVERRAPDPDPPAQLPGLSPQKPKNTPP